MSLQLLLASPASVEVINAADEAGSGRAGSVAALLLGMVSVLLGGLALARANRRAPRNGLNGALAGLALGLTGVAVSLLLLAGPAGDVGTGDGRGGAVAALAVCALGAGVGAVAAARSRRVARSAA